MIWSVGLELNEQSGKSIWHAASAKAHVSARRNGAEERLGCAARSAWWSVAKRQLMEIHDCSE